MAASTSAPPIIGCPTWSWTSGVRSTSSLVPGSTASKAGCGPHSTTVPDTPVSSVSLPAHRREEGAALKTAKACVGTRKKASAKLTAQNGLVMDTERQVVEKRSTDRPRGEGEQMRRGILNKCIVLRHRSRPQPQLCTGLASAKVFAPHAYNGTYPAGSFHGSGCGRKRSSILASRSERWRSIKAPRNHLPVGEEGGGFGSEPGFLYKLDYGRRVSAIQCPRSEHRDWGRHICPTAPENTEVSTTPERSHPGPDNIRVGLRVTPTSRASCHRGKKWALSNRATPR